jgi:tetratricopeptide (TPR) repeat protein
MSIFVGRRDEQEQFIEWVEREPPASERRAALVVGPAGMGKTALLIRFERICRERPEPRWFMQRLLLNANEAPAAFFERLLGDAHRLFLTKPLKSGPHDRRLLREMLKSIPAAGRMLAALVNDVKRPEWERFIDYTETLSAVLAERGERYVLLIDPDRAMDQGQADEWLSVAQRLPPGVRVLIAQRPDDVIAAHPESARLLGRIPIDRDLAELDETAVGEWYEDEFIGGRLVEYVKSWSADVRLRLPRVAFERYGGYPVAHEAVVRLLVTASVDDPLTEIESWPRELRELLDMLFDRLTACGEEDLRAALVLQVFCLATPLESWAKAAGMTAEGLIAALRAPRFRHFFAEVDTPYGPGHVPFHPLFAERLENELERVPQRREELGEAAWKAIEPELDEQKLATSVPREFELRAATSVADRFRDVERLLAATDRVFGVKLRLGALSEAEGDLRRIHARTADRQDCAAAFMANLGVIYQTRGDLGEAERMYRKALEISEQLGRLEGVARAYGNLGVIYQTRGDLDGAERMLRKALEMNQQLGRLEGVASDYGNLGLIYQTRGDLDKAERMHRKALELNQKLGRLKGVAIQYGNLGLIYETRGDLDEAEWMHRKALEINQKLGRLEGMAADYGNLGLIYQTRGDLDEAERMHRKALDIEEKLGRLEGIANQYGNLGLVYDRRGDLDEAERMLHETLEIDERLARLEGMAKAYGNLGVICQTRGDLDKAEEMHRKSLEINEKLGRPKGMAMQCGNLGSVYKNQGDLERAREYWIKARDLFDRIGMPHEVERVERLLDGLSRSDTPGD